MKGLLLNNIYAALANTKVFSVIMLLFGVVTVASAKKIPSLLLIYTQLAMIGFSLNAIASFRKDSAGKWVKYKLAMPVRRAQIIKSCFVSSLIWLIVGMAFAGIVVASSCLLHGTLFDKSIDGLSLFVMGISISLFMCAVFFPLLYLGGEERAEVVLILSLLCGAAIFMGCTALVNALLPHPTLRQLILEEIALLACALLVFLLSIPLTVDIFKKMEY